LRRLLLRLLLPLAQVRVWHHKGSFKAVLVRYLHHQRIHSVLRSAHRLLVTHSLLDAFTLHVQRLELLLERIHRLTANEYEKKKREKNTKSFGDSVLKHTQLFKQQEKKESKKVFDVFRSFVRSAGMSVLSLSGDGTGGL
jgi:hypothetical protein